MRARRGFTLLEMLISTVLLSLVLLGLYGALNMQQRSTRHLYDFLAQALDADRGAMTLYRDIAQSDGNISLVNGEFDRLCLAATSHSLHGLAQAKVCWVVAKEGRALLRIEGNDFRLPLRHGDGVEIDEVLKPVALFDIQKDKKNVLVALQQVNRDPYVFLVQGVEPPPKAKKKKTPPKGKGKSKPSKGSPSKGHGGHRTPGSKKGGPKSPSSTRPGSDRGGPPPETEPVEGAQPNLF